MKLEVRDYYRGPTGDIDPKRSEFYELEPNIMDRKFM